MQTAGGAQVTRLRAALIALGVVALDQLTKSAVVATLPEGGSRPVIGDLLRLSHIRNTGAAFGILRGFGGLLALVALVGVIVLVAIVVRRPPFVTAMGAALVAAGATGNLIDRLFRSGGVVDFVDFRFWPAFNVADSAVTIGAIVILFSGALERPRGDAPGGEDGGPPAGR